VTRTELDPKALYAHGRGVLAVRTISATSAPASTSRSTASRSGRPETRRDYSFTDDFDQPLDRNGKVTPDPFSISQILAWWDPVTRHYTSYTTT
jgi:hypothetical protein